MELDHNLLKMINEYVEEGDFTGSISENDIMNAEIALELSFPQEYKEFVRMYGSGGIGGVEIHGVEGPEYASVVEHTVRYRKLGLPTKYVVLEHADEFVYCLNTEEDHVVVRWDAVWKKEIKRYNSFDEYAEDSFSEAIDNLD
ncbi:SMI1/KNR4 family protein [Rossellomorea vietnamensis]|uniref:SMI1/KNR4 family protein n=1 Tax=Rossellomorea vietnamensis TaxID=218284 RepID=UPI000AC85A71|nr:SMI1/KNR4 family protein [Rossellomorea vietnamensis]